MTQNADSRFMAEYDMLRTIAIIGMVLIHVAETFSGYSGMKTDDSYNGSLPAVIYMIPMGVLIALSKNNTPKRMMTRGLVLFLMGFILNFLRDFIPNTTLVHAPADTLVSMLLCVDILQFAGLTFILFAVMKGLHLKDWHIVVIAVAMLLISTVAIWFIKIDEPIIKQVYGLFIFCGGRFIWFPLLSWFIYPVVGYVLGKYLLKTDDRGKIYIKLFAVGVIGLAVTIGAIVFSGIGLWTFIMDVTGNYTNTVLGAVGMICVTLIIVPILYFIQKNITSKKIHAAFRYISKNLTPIYLMQWMIISWLGVILLSLNAINVPVWSWYFIAFAVFAACLCLTPLYVRVKGRFTGMMNES